jgi:hypothetical protein
MIIELTAISKKETTQRRKGAGYSGKNFASLRLGVEAFG